MLNWRLNEINKTTFAGKRIRETYREASDVYLGRRDLSQREKLHYLRYGDGTKQRLVYLV